MDQPSTPMKVDSGLTVPMLQTFALSIVSVVATFGALMSVLKTHDVAQIQTFIKGSGFIGAISALGVVLSIGGLILRRAVSKLKEIYFAWHADDRLVQIKQSIAEPPPPPANVLELVTGSRSVEPPTPLANAPADPQKETKL